MRLIMLMIGLSAAIVVWGATRSGQATAKFSQETGKACNFCHTMPPPALNEVGRKWKANGNKL